MTEAVRSALIDAQGAVVNVIKAAPDFAVDGFSVIAIPDGVPVSSGWTYSGGSFSPQVQDIAERRAAMVASVLAERAARLAAGFDYDFGDERGEHHIGTTGTDMAGWDEVSKIAAALMALDQGAQTIDIVTNTGPCTVTALEWQAVLVAAAAFRQPIWAYSFTLQAQIAAAADHAALDAIDIDAGWPA